MSFSSKAASLVFVLGCLGFSASPVLALGTCAFTCGTGPTATHPPSRSSVADAGACTCTPSPCAAGIACVAAFTVDAAPVAEPPTNVCACVCTGTGGPSPVTATTTRSCLPVALVDAACRPFCVTLCRDGRADGPARAGMTLDPAPESASCVVALPPVAIPPAADVPATTGSGSSGVSPTNANREAVPLQLSQPIDGVSVVSDFGNYIAVVYRYVIGLVGTAAVVMIVYGGFLYLLGSATGDVGKGKQIIQDAIIGLMLVLGSYTILATVNPETLSLKMPEIKTIAPVALPDTPPPAATTNICNSPQDPTVGSAVRRVPSRGRINVPNGQRCAYDEECGSGICFMENQTQGVCSDLSEGSRCRCIGQCCGAMTAVNEPTYLADTNQRGNGNGLCANGLACQQDGDDWKCKSLTSVASGGTLRTGAPVRPAGIQHSSCMLDSECVTALHDPSAACLYNSRMRDSISGRTECSLGREGDQCQCSGFGCDLSAPPTVRVTGAQVALGNNHGTGRVACQAGLECAPFLRPYGTRSNPQDLEYFCQRPVAAAQCHFTCSDGTPAGPQTVPGGCQVADIGVISGSRACLTACEGVCGAPGMTNCLGLRCEAASPAP